MPGAAALSGFAAATAAAAKRLRNACVPYDVRFFKNNIKCIQSVGVNVGGRGGLEEVVVWQSLGIVV